MCLYYQYGTLAKQKGGDFMEFGSPSYSFNLPEPLQISKPIVSGWHDHSYPQHHDGYARGMNERHSDGTFFSQDFDANRMPQYQSQLIMPQGTFIPPNMLGPL